MNISAENLPYRISCQTVRLGKLIFDNKMRSTVRLLSIVSIEFYNIRFRYYFNILN